jgi:pilus assembly protein CpaD
MVSNPADLLGPRTMTPSDANRRYKMYDKYVKGQPLGAEAEAVTIAKSISN